MKIRYDPSAIVERWMAAIGNAKRFKGGIDNDWMPKCPICYCGQWHAAPGLVLTHLLMADGSQCESPEVQVQCHDCGYRISIDAALVCDIDREEQPRIIVPKLELVKK